MSKTKLEIQFDGSGFFGWQIQKNSSPTVQELINKALQEIYKVPIKTVGSGRTDTGVHALKFFVVFEQPFEINPEGLVKGLNTKLPDEIRVKAAESVADSFRPTNDALKREYRYYFTNNDLVVPFQKKYIANISYPLDLDKIQLACKEFVGTYDFASYQTSGSDVSSTTRTIFECSLHEQNRLRESFMPDHYYIKVVGSGFLKQMVRLMVGALWDVGRGKISSEQIQKSLTVELGTHIAPVAPPEGLYKYDIQY